jgi:hypothetical protein
LRIRLCLTALAIAAAGCAHAPRGESRALSGRQVLTRRCQICHAMPDPRKYSSERWTVGVARMRLRLRLPEAEWDSLLAMVGDSSAAR